MSLDTSKQLKRLTRPTVWRPPKSTANSPTEGKISQRISGYSRLPGDTYQTPGWVTRCLLPHIPQRSTIWEPACGEGKMSGELGVAGHNVLASDILTGRDFLTWDPGCIDGIVTNPPYSQARQFIERALGLTRAYAGFVAMLLRTDYDHAHTRRSLFVQPPFAKKVVLTRRIRWIENSNGSPSFNHAWYLWDWTHEGEPVIVYEPQLIEDGDG